MAKTPSELGAMPVVVVGPDSPLPATPVVLLDAAGNPVTIPTQAQFDAKANSLMAFSNQTDDYTLVISDAGKRVSLSNAGGKTITVPPNASVAFPVGTEIEVFQPGAGQVTIAAGAAVTINSKGGNLKLTGQWSAGVLTKTATNTWTLVGDLSS